MRTKLNEDTQLDELLVKLEEVQVLATEIDNLKIDLHNKINKIKGKRGRFTASTNGQEIKQEKVHKRGINKIENSTIEEEILLKYEREITSLSNKLEEIRKRSGKASKAFPITSDNSKLYLTERTTGEFEKGDKVKVTNHYRGKFGDLFGKVGTIQEVGKAFVFIKFPDIPVLQQRTEANIQLVEES